MKKQIKAEGKDDKLFDDNNIGKSLIETTANITTVVANLSGLLAPNNLIGAALIRLLS